MATVLTDSFLRNAVAHGLFALSFMDDHNLSASPTSFEVVANAVRQYGVTP